MKNIVGMFLPFFLFLFFTIVLFFVLKEDGSSTSDTNQKQVKKIFKEVNVHKKEVRVKKRRTTTSNASVTRVRWHQHDGYERLVFDISNDNQGTFKMWVDTQNNTKIHGEFMGYSDFTQVLPSFRSSTIVKDMEVYLEGNNGYNFTISLYRPMDYKIFALKKPARIVIDMY